MNVLVQAGSAVSRVAELVNSRSLHEGNGTPQSLASSRPSNKDK